MGKSFRIMLAILAMDPSYEMEHWDIRQAFTSAPLADEIYMHLPENFDEKKNSVVLKLQKSLYGLKQAARNFAHFLRESFVKCQFFALHADNCVYLCRTTDGGWCVACTHVDDIFCLFNPRGKECRDRLYEKISQTVEIENLGPVSWALKTHILRDREKGIVKISQEGYILSLLKKKGLEPNFNEKSIVPTIEEKISEKFIEKFEVKEKSVIQSEIGSLWWLAQISRPDIFYALHRCAKMVNTPSKLLSARLSQIFSYLTQTFKIGLVYSFPDFEKLSRPLSGFADAAFAAENNVNSRVAYFYQFYGNLISWSSENPSRMMTSSTEAECRALTHFSKENVWQRQIQGELKLYDTSPATRVYEDNTSTISLAHNDGVPHKRSKHFGIRVVVCQGVYQTW